MLCQLNVRAAFGSVLEEFLPGYADSISGQLADRSSEHHDGKAGPGSCDGYRRRGRRELVVVDVAVKDVPPVGVRERRCRRAVKDVPRSVREDRSTSWSDVPRSARHRWARSVDPRTSATLRRNEVRPRPGAVETALGHASIASNDAEAQSSDGVRGLAHTSGEFHAGRSGEHPAQPEPDSVEHSAADRYPFCAALCGHAAHRLRQRVLPGTSTRPLARHRRHRRRTARRPRRPTARAAPEHRPGTRAATGSPGTAPSPPRRQPATRRRTDPDPPAGTAASPTRPQNPEPPVRPPDLLLGRSSQPTCLS